MVEAEGIPTKSVLSKFVDLGTSSLHWRGGLQGDLHGGTCDDERQFTLQNMLPLTGGSMLGTKQHLKQKEIAIKTKASTRSSKSTSLNYVRQQGKDHAETDNEGAKPNR